MALTYQLFTTLEPEAPRERLETFWRKVDAGRRWVLANTRPADENSLHMCACEGVPGPYASYVSIRFWKDNPMAERALVKRFFATLPEPKAMLFEGEALKNPEEFRRLDPEAA